MSFEYNVFTNQEIDFVFLGKMCEYLKKNVIFEDAILTKRGISIPDKRSDWKLVEISLISKGIFICLNLNGTQRNDLLILIQNFMQDQGLYIEIEDS